MEKDVEQMVEDITEDQTFRSINFLINASNQANLTNVNDTPYVQINALFVVVHPYRLNDVKIEDLSLEVQLADDGSIFVNEKKYDVVDVQPGIKVFGIVKRDGD